jgi:hypothetical protein
MSHEHVDAMNTVLARSTEVAAECQKLDRTYVVAYRLAHRDGATEHWTMALGPAGVRFGLAPLADPDLCFVADYEDMLEATKAGRAGAATDLTPTMEGDTTVMERIGAAFALARGVATLDVEFPEAT